MALAFGCIEFVSVRHFVEQNPPEACEFGLKVRVSLALLDFEYVVGPFEIGTYDDLHLFGSHVRYDQSLQVGPLTLH